MLYSGCYDVYQIWLNTTILDNDILPIGYTAYQLDRGTKGGGMQIIEGIATLYVLFTSKYIVFLHLYNNDSFHCALHGYQFLPKLNLAYTHFHLIMGNFNAPDTN